MNWVKKPEVYRKHLRRRGAHQWLSSSPPELLSQELNHGLEVIRNGHSKKVLLHYRRVSDRLEAHDDCTDEGLTRWRSVSSRVEAQADDGGREGWMYEPFAGSFFLYDSRAARPSARPASAGSGAVNEEDGWMASGVSAMQSCAAYYQQTHFHLDTGNCRQPSSSRLLMSFFQRLSL